MSTTTEQMQRWIETVLGVAPPPVASLNDYLDGIPGLDSLDKLPAGTAVLVRGDLDCEPKEEVGKGDIRLRSMVDTLQFGRDRGWKQIVFGHVGRKPDGTLAKVAERIGTLLGCEAPLIEDWLDPATGQLRDDAVERIRAAAPGSVLVLQNTRQYALERILWHDTPDERAQLLGNLPAISESLAKLANDFAHHVARVYVNEAFSAGSLDTSTVAVPAAMDRAVLGKYVLGQFRGPMQECLRAELVVFSGVKADKLADLKAIIERGTVRWVFAAGALCMALKKAAAQRSGGDFCVGVAENPVNARKSWYVSPEHVALAKEVLALAAQHGVQVVLPVDFRLAQSEAETRDAMPVRVVESLAPDDQQLDIGPKSQELFAAKIDEFLRSAAGRQPVVFHNGVFGYFEDDRYIEGTRDFVQRQFPKLAAAGAKVFVGGGEGGKAWDKFGDKKSVTHNFTAGGTVLNALGKDPVPFLVALWLANRK